MLVKVTFWGGRVLGLMGMLACIIIGFLADSMYRPFWWFGGYIVVFSMVNLTTLAMSVLTVKPSGDIKELARNLIIERVSNANINDAINFMLRRQYKEADLEHEIDEWLPAEEKGNYTIVTQPFCWSVLTMLLGKGIRPALLVYKAHFYHLKTSLDDAVTLISIAMLALVNFNALPWDFWTGIGMQHGLYVGAGIGGLLIVWKYLQMWIMKKEVLTDWRGITDGLIGMTLLPALEEVSMGWIMPVFIATVALSLGMPPVVASAIGIGISTLYYVLATLWHGWVQAAFTVFIRVICGSLMLIYGFPTVMLLRFIIHTEGFIYDWIIVRRRRRESPLNLYE
jgi:hypothetical protein